MKELDFFDFATKRKFKSDDYQVVIKNGRRFAVAKGISGKESWRALPKE